ncbi:MAG: hypothetical protein KC420_15505, partial [Myxococcales bacterium]|nr:hypothetical protein [Myxococcales bacterium]
PVETNDLWEQCEADGDICGDAGFCAVDREAQGGHGGALAFVIGIGLAAARRRRWIRKIP